MSTKGEPIRVVVAGATGRVGCEMVQALLREPGFILAGGIAAGHAGGGIGKRAELPDIMLHPDLQTALQAGLQADVLIDFSTAAAAKKTIPTAIAASIAPVVGTTGLADEEIRQFADACRAQGIGGAFIANYAVGAMLMMRFAEEAIRFFPHAEIIEMHHHTKLDAPSGTALRTKQRLERARGDLMVPTVPVHAVRLPGLAAHQEVLLGGLGQTLTIRHDVTSREAYAPGVLMTCNWVCRERRVAFDLQDVAFGD